jgi:DNA (cytosine-5)-methyltransferase 1
MGYDKPTGSEFRIPVSDTQAYKQFGNSVVVPVFAAVAKLMKPHIKAATEKQLKAKRKAA